MEEPNEARPKPRIFFVSAVPLFGRVDLSGVVTSGFTFRQVMWIIALAIALLSPSARRSLRVN